MAEKQFAKGVYFSVPSEKAPDFIKGRLSFKVEEAIAFLREHNNNAGYVNCDIKESKSGKIYVELNTFKVEKPDALKTEAEVVEDTIESIPF